MHTETSNLVHVQFHIQFGAWKSITSPNMPKICQACKILRLKWSEVPRTVPFSADIFFTFSAKNPPTF